MTYTTKSQLDKDLKHWTKTLRLQDWDIRVEVKNHDDWGGANGTCFLYPELKSALIYLADPKSYVGCNHSAFPYDMEQTLVHELLHVHFVMWQPTDEDDPRYTLFEQTTQSLSQAIVALKRSKT